MKATIKFEGIKFISHDLFLNYNFNSNIILFKEILFGYI